MSSAKNDDCTEIEIENGRVVLDTHVGIVVLSRNYFIFNYSEKTAEFQPFSPGHKSLDKVPIVDNITQHDEP